MKKNTKKEATASIEHEDSYIRAYEDIELLNKPVMRPVRIELEVMKPELYLQALNITQSIVCFGSARVKPQKEAKAAVEAAQKALAQKPKSKALQDSANLTRHVQHPEKLILPVILTNRTMQLVFQ